MADLHCDSLCWQVFVETIFKNQLLKLQISMNFYLFLPTGPWFPPGRAVLFRKRKEEIFKIVLQHRLILTDTPSRIHVTINKPNTWMCHYILFLYIRFIKHLQSFSCLVASWPVDQSPAGVSSISPESYQKKKVELRRTLFKTPSAILCHF